MLKINNNDTRIKPKGIALVLLLWTWKKYMPTWSVSSKKLSIFKSSDISGIFTSYLDIFGHVVAYLEPKIYSKLCQGIFCQNLAYSESCVTLAC